MIDNISLAITHALMLVAAILLLRRPDLDDESPAEEASPKPRRGRRGSRGA